MEIRLLSVCSSRKKSVAADDRPLRTSSLHLGARWCLLVALSVACALAWVTASETARAIELPAFAGFQNHDDAHRSEKDGSSGKPTEPRRESRSPSLAPAGQTSIHTIQGSGTTSPLAEQTVTTSGIVTGRKRNGFFIQAPDAEADNDPNTSEGIFVFTSSSPPSVAAVGNAVTVSGTVQEFKPLSDPNSPPLTEISGSPAVTLVSTGNVLPTPLAISDTDVSTGGSLEQLEKFEGMRVRVASMTVVAPTGGSVNEAAATASSNGIFYGVLSGFARPFREPGIEVPNPLPEGAPANVPRFDANPEKLRVDSNGLIGASIVNVTSGVTITNLIGIMDYGSRAYTILPDQTTPAEISENSSAVAVPPQSDGELTVSSFNLERFFDTDNDPHTGDVVLTPAAFNARLSKASLAIRNVMRMPDVIGVEEVENLTTLQTIADKINGDAVSAGSANPNYQAFLIDGNDPAGIDVGLLVKGSRVAVNGVTQEGKTTTFVDPTDGSVDTLNDRPPLVLRGSITADGTLPFAFTLIVNHLRSLTSIDDPASGPRIRAKRRAQAEFLANLIQTFQTSDPTDHVIVVGDFNAFQFNDGYVDVIGTVRGSPTPADQVVLASSDLVNPDLTDVIHFAPPEQRYSFVFGGNAQALDHILVSTNLLGSLSRFAYARANADFPEVFRNDPNRPERVSDHDMPVAYFTLPSTRSDLSISVVDSPDPVPSGGAVTYTVTISNAGPDAALGVVVFDSLLNPGESRNIGVVLAGGTSVLRIVRQVTESAGATLDFTAIVASASFDPVLANNQASATTAVSAAAPKISSAVLSGKKFLVGGEGFQVGAVIEVNGIAVKTTNDPLNPSGALIGKNAKPLIPKRLTVAITVLNPDGQRSSAFPFTR